jgi:hypothetical protein
MIRKVLLGAVVAVVIGLGTQTASAAPAVRVEPNTARLYRGPYGPRLYPYYHPYKAPRGWWHGPGHWRR